MFNSLLFRIFIVGCVLFLPSFAAYAGLEQYITVNHKTDFGPRLVGSAYLDFASPNQPVGIGWSGAVEASVTLDTAPPFGFTGNWVTTPQVGRWKYNSSTQVTMPAPSQPVADIGLYFAPDREGYIPAGNGLFATGFDSGYREIKIEGVGAGDNISTPALQLDAQAKINGRIQSQCQNVGFCELNLGSNDTLTFTLTPSVNTHIASLPALQAGTVPAESDMNRAALNLNFDDPGQVSTFLQQIRYVKLNTAVQGSSSAICSRQLAAFQSQLLNADTISQTGYFQDLTANNATSEGCVGYSFLMSPGKPAELKVQTVNGTGDNGYVDYMFYFPGHFDTNNPQRGEYPGSHKTFRLRAGSGGGTPTNYSVSFSLPSTASVSSGAPYTTTVSAAASGFTPQSYQWSGAGMQISNPTAATTSITITSAGIYNLQVTATGANGEIATYSRAINAVDPTVTPPPDPDPPVVTPPDNTGGNNPPTVRIYAGGTQLTTTQPYPVDAGQSITVNATATDSDGSIASYAWDVQEGAIVFGRFVGGPTQKASITSPNANSTQITFSQGGDFQVRMIVYDNGGSVGVAQGLVTVSGGGGTTPTPTPTNQPPVANFTLNTAQGVSGLTINANGSSSSDADDGIAAFAWSVKPDTGVTIANPAGVQTNITFDNPGTYQVSLRVMDNSGSSALSTPQAVTVNALPTPLANCTATPQTVNQGEIVHLSAVDPANSSRQGPVDAPLTKFTWSSPSGEFILPDGSRTEGTADSPELAIIFDAAGVVDIDLVVTDSQGTESTPAVCAVTVNKQVIPELPELQVYEYSFLTQDLQPSGNDIHIRGGLREVPGGQLLRARQDEDIPAGTNTEISMEIDIAQAHQGQPGETVVLLYLDIDAVSGWFNLNPVYTLLAWDGNLTTPPFMPYGIYTELPETVTIPIFNGMLPLGMYKLYAGYIYAGDINTIYFSGEEFSVR